MSGGIYDAEPPTWWRDNHGMDNANEPLEVIRGLPIAVDELRPHLDCPDASAIPSDGIDEGVPVQGSTGKR